MIACDSQLNKKSESKHDLFSDSIRVKSQTLAFIEGKFQFNRLCNNCHVAPEVKKLDQYTFDNLFERLPQPGEQYFTEFITDSKSLKESGNTYALQIDKAYDSPFEHIFRDSLTKTQIAFLITYLKVGDKMTQR